MKKTLTGVDYRKYVWAVARQRSSRNYLEVGVHAGKTLVGIDCPAIGVDPSYIQGLNPVGAKKELHLYQMGSDEYFRDHDPRRTFGCDVDLAFLDGLHQFEYLLRDFIHTEAVCARRSLIMLDDCLPLDLEIAERVWKPEGRTIPETSGGWTGDVWKVVSILRKYRPDLKIVPVDTQPTGNVGVTNLDPTSSVLSDLYHEIIEDFRHIKLQDVWDEFWNANEPVSSELVLSGNNLSLYFPT